jgi:hypothetical protein
LNFYTKDGTLIRTCEQYKTESVTNKTFITKRNLKRLKFFDIKFRVALCPLVFENAHINMVFINNLVDSFYKKNVIQFLNETGNKSFEASIE